MKKMLAVITILITSFAFAQKVNATDVLPQVNVPDIQPIINLSQEFVSGQRGVRDMVTKEVNVADPHNHIGTVLTSSDGKFMTLIENIKVSYKQGTALFTARVATIETTEAKRSDITAGKITIAYEQKDGAWQLTSIALKREVISGR